MHPAKTNTATPPNITENAIIKSAISITLPAYYYLSLCLYHRIFFKICQEQN